MSQYTTQLRYILQNPQWTDERLGLSSYPIFDEDYRITLNNHIKDYFYFEEIGFETPARFCFKLRQKMNLIMPYYNKLYESELLKIEPFLNISTENELIEKIVVALKELTNKNSNATKNVNASNKKQDDSKRTLSENSTNTETSEKTSKNQLVSKDEHGGTITDTKVENGDTVITYNSNNTEKRDLKTTDTTANESAVNSTNSSAKTYDNYKENTTHSSTETDDNTTKEISSDTPNGLLNDFSMTAAKYADNAKINTVDNSKKNNGTDAKTITGSVNDTGNNNSTETKSENKNGTDTGSITTEKSGHDDTSIKNHVIATTTNDNSTLDKSETIDYSDSVNTKNVFEKNNVDVYTDTQATTDKITELNALIDELIHSLDSTNDKNTKNTTKGFSGITMSKMLLEFRETFINIDMMIIEELKDLFMLVMS